MKKNTLYNKYNYCYYEYIADIFFLKIIFIIYQLFLLSSSSLLSLLPLDAGATLLPTSSLTPSLTHVPSSFPPVQHGPISSSLDVVIITKYFYDENGKLLNGARAHRDPDTLYRKVPVQGDLNKRIIRSLRFRKKNF